MIAVIIDNVNSKEILDDIANYRLVFFINTKKRASKIYTAIKKRVKGIEIKVNVDDCDLIEKIAKGIASEFAEFKEPIHIWIKDKCIVY